MTRTARAFDVIVVGAGPAGCAVATRLSRAGRRILLIEAGGGARHPLLSIPAAMLLTMRDPRYTWRFATEPEAGLGGRALDWFGGRTVGGGSAINGMMYLRGHPADYDRWRDTAGCPGWGFEDVSPFFRRAEGSDRGASPWLGHDGPIGITRGIAEPAIGPAFLATMREAGFPIVDDLNGGVREGFGYFDRTIAGGRRSSAGRAYLSRIADCKSLTLWTGARVTSLIVENGRACGIRVVRGGRTSDVRTDGEVVLAAGCVNTAHLLLLSGIGPGEALRRLGIGVVADLAGVGANVQNHVAFAQSYAIASPITAFQLRHPLNAARAATDYALFRHGMLAGPLCPVGGLMRVDPQVAVADVQVILGAGLAGSGSGWRGLLPERNGFTLMLNQGRPFSRGTISLRSADPAIPPIVRSGFFSDPRDIALLADGVERVRAVMARHPIAGEMAQPLGMTGNGSRAALLEEIRSRASSYYHAVGSCRMGTDDSAVVDPALRVRGVAGLRIADTSVAPLLVNGNTTAMALMLGERAADLMLGD